MVQARHAVAPIVSAHGASTYDSQSDGAARSDGLQRHIASGLMPWYMAPNGRTEGSIDWTRRRWGAAGGGRAGREEGSKILN